MTIKKNESFSKRNINEYEKRELSNRSLLIGRNGSGKSRFLQALLECHKEIPELENSVIVSLDFSKEPQEGEFNNDIGGVLVYLHNMNSDELKDLVNYIYTDLEKFFEALPTYWRGKGGQISRQSFLSAFNEYAKKILEREIHINETECSIERAKNAEDTKEHVRINEEIKLISPGERKILQLILALLLLKAGNSISNTTLLIDEPEVHLHPKALLCFFDFLEECGLKYLFVASHSIFLLTRFKFEEIIYMVNGTVARFSSKVYSEIYEDLIGKNDDSIHVLLSSTYEWEYINYIVECFERPSTVDRASARDPQLRQLLEHLSEESTGEGIMNVLDFGAGTGRIARCLQLLIDNNGYEKKFRYIVYDKEPDESVKNIPCVDSLIDWQLNEAHHKKFNLIILFNVLHEIDITEWEDELNLMLKLLTDDGFLLFGEQRVLTKGEDPYGKSGYLVLNRPQLEILFGKDAIGDVLVEQSKDTVCFSVSKAKAKVVTKSDVIKALVSLEECTLDEIEKHLLKKDGPDKPKPREYAFFLQQYINAKHALKLRGYERGRAEEIKSTFAQIMRDFSGRTLNEKLRERGETDDDEGRKCREELERINYDVEVR